MGSDCTKCDLHAGARNVCMAGRGPKRAEVMIVGQTPTYFEDKYDELGIGTAGDALREYVANAGFAWADVYITTAVKCATPDVPSAKQTNACRAYLAEEIAAVQPKLIIALGNVALKTLTGASGVTKKRGELLDLHATFLYRAEVVATLSPAAALRYPEQAMLIVEDFKKAALRCGIMQYKKIDTTFHEQWPRLESWNQKFIAYDIETTGLDGKAQDADLLCVAFDEDWMGLSVASNNLFPWGWKRITAGKTLNFVGHNSAAFDSKYLRDLYGVEIKGHDTMLMAYLLDETQSLKLEALAVKYLGVQPWKDDVYWDFATFKETADAKQWHDLKTYCARDTRYTRLLAEKFEIELKRRGQWAVYEHILLPTQDLTRAMQDNGMHISVENCKNGMLQAETRKDNALLILQATGERCGLNNFNPGSSAQVATLLYENSEKVFGKKIKPPMLTKSGKPATDEFTLLRVALANPHPVIDALLEYRGACKEISTYYKPYLKLAAESPDGRAHPIYTSTYTDTGRLSARRPNSQNIPRKTELRAMIAAPPGKLIGQVDYSQLEMRVMAFESRCPNLMAAFREGQDTHRLMAARITGKAHDPSLVTKQERTDAKPVNFMFLYGAEEYTFSKTMLQNYGKNISRSEATVVREAFFQQWPGLPAYYTSVFDECRANGYVTSATGRRRHLPNIHATDESVRIEALRMAINFRIQSFANCIALIAFRMIHDAGYKMIYSVHDSAGTELDLNVDILGFQAEMKYITERRAPAFLEKHFGIYIDVPLIGDVSVGPDWGHLEELK